MALNETEMVLKLSGLPEAENKTRGGKLLAPPTTLSTLIFRVH